MSDEAENCQAQVSGIPEDLTSEDLLLFFESERYCPNGGEVKNIRYLSSDVVVVTFYDSKVVGRLERCLTFPGEVKLFVERFITSKSLDVVTDDTGINTSREHSDSESSFRSSSPCLFSERNEENGEDHQVKTSSSGGANMSRSSSKSSINSINSQRSDRSNISLKSANSFIDFPDMHHHSAGSRSSSSSNRSKSDISVAIASESLSWNNNSSEKLSKPFGNNTSNAVFGHKTNSNRSNSYAGNMSNSYAGNRSHTFCAKKNNTLTFDRSNTFSGKKSRSRSKAKNRDVLMRRDSSMLECGSENSRLRNSKHLWKSQEEVLTDCPADGLFRTSDEDVPRVSFSAEKKTETISFSIEKLKLLKLFYESKGRRNTDGCCVRFDETSKTVTLEGRHKDLMSMKLDLHEVALQAVTSHVEIAKSSQKLLLSKRGGEWLAREFSQRLLVAIFYVLEGKAHIVALDDTTLQSACDLLDQILTSQKLPFDESTTSYLKSATWATKIEETESSGLVSIDTDYFQKLILITGCANDVNNCTLEVIKILKMNTSTTRSLKHKIGVVRLLKSHSHEITAKVSKATGATVHLEFDVQQGMIKVTGLLDDVDEAAKFIDTNYLKVVCYEKYEVNIQGLTLEMFKSKISPGSEMIDLLELRNKCVIEVRGNSTRAAEPQRAPRAVENVAAKATKKKWNRIQLHQGSIVEFKADVLVNSVAHRNLERAGIVTTSFLRAGGSRLQQELRQSVPQDFGSDVVMTSAGGRLDAKWIFHAAIRRYRNQESLDRLFDLIKKCLEMAGKQHGVSSIAFPTLGCGKLGYDPKDVADCFSQAVKKTSSDLQVSIVAFEDHLLRDFKSRFSHDSSAGSSDSETNDSWFGGKFKKFIGGFSRPSMPVNNRIVFHINAMSDDVAREVRENLVRRINEMVTEAPIKDEAIADLSDETASRIAALASSDVEVRIDRKKSTITVKGVKSVVDEIKMKVLCLVYKEGSTQERHRGSQSQSSVRYPKHWSHYKLGQPAGKMDLKRTELPQIGGVFDEVSRLVMKTWEQQKVGHGNDAAGLGPHSIKIRKIFCIENPSLYRTYMSRREEFCLGASVNRCHRVNGLQGEREIMTVKLGLKQLEASLASEVNECYLLHGTKRDMVESIESTGLDSRLSGQNVLFGPGTYFTESSTKADQYADAKNQRVPNGQPLYMYVCRVLLGQTFICQTPKPFKRPPCMQAGCHSDQCSAKHPFVGTFESVIGTHKSPTVRLLFREFVIYHPDQSYPEFLVEYERQ